MKLNIIYLFLVVVLFTACNKQEQNGSFTDSKSTLQSLLFDADNDDNDIKNNNDDKKDNDDNDDNDGKESCFELVYPLSITMPDGTELSGKEKGLWTDVKSWYKAHPDSKAIPSLNYPVKILWKDGVTKTINSEKEMIIAKKYCDEKEIKEKDCFVLVYPITWTMPDGTNITMNDAKDLAGIKAWYEAHPDSKAKPSLDYPVDILLKDGTTHTVADENEMIVIKKDC